jgi:hypothetical protein
MPTSTAPLATPNNRFIDFRVDDDEIEAGECVRFSWIVKGDIGIVEFNEVNDNKNAILVSAEGTQEACPTKETAYELAITWLDNSRGGRGLTIKIKSQNNNQGGNSSSTGSSSTSSNTTAPGTFVAVTPILIQTTPTLTASGSPATPPAGIFSAARTLPETGRRSPSGLADPDKTDLSQPSTLPEASQPSVLAGLIEHSQVWLLLGLAVISLTLGRRILSSRKGTIK